MWKSSFGVDTIGLGSDCNDTLTEDGSDEIIGFSSSEFIGVGRLWATIGITP
ncbi:hypothetical protein FC50_GL001520 [Lacticaseibacillus pantheris DSM 15945 = JCM 12539 = NBRC 106106]|uniref:Uncharacterized protein n=1 Tax=Lacticaseibacillus pantheris DSM 15945 = JCM 12539 = NBRC 106106 TaxID=1423783 RepID=A0A0R1TWR8_9LACO|nr:hypothetical protein FC50_GL001520 [Lacticaseibacillus pantheris DSM 15945 = JCM 12539 = NBRC 106106]